MPISPTSSPGPIAAALFVAALLLPLTAQANWGDKYLTGQFSYTPVLTADGAGRLHYPELALGGGYFVSDFALVEADLFYAPTYGNDSFRQFWGAEVSFRMLIDMTQWVPSIGPLAGWAFFHSAPNGFVHSAYLGGQACLDYRSKRSFALGVCGELAVGIDDDVFTGYQSVGFRFSGFLPYLFE
jgi:hypothetical protein